MFQQRLKTKLSTLPLGNACVQLQNDLGGTPNWSMGFWHNGDDGIPTITGGVPTMDVCDNRGTDDDDDEIVYGTVTSIDDVLTWTSADGETLEGVEDIAAAITGCLTRHMIHLIAGADNDKAARDNREWAAVIGIDLTLDEGSHE